MLSILNDSCQNIPERQLPGVYLTTKRQRTIWGLHCGSAHELFLKILKRILICIIPILIVSALLSQVGEGSSDLAEPLYETSENCKSPTKLLSSYIDFGLGQSLTNFCLSSPMLVPFFPTRNPRSSVLGVID